MNNQKILIVEDEPTVSRIVKSYFEKEGYELMSMISLGVPEEKTPPQPARKPLEDVITFID